MGLINYIFVWFPVFDILFMLLAMIEVNPFHATDLFWYLLKTSENQRFSDIFRRYQKRSVVWNGLTVFQPLRIFKIRCIWQGPKCVYGNYCISNRKLQKPDKMMSKKIIAPIWLLLALVSGKHGILYTHKNEKQ